MPCAAAIPVGWIQPPHAADASRVRHDVVARPGGERFDHGLRSIEVVVDPHRYGERSCTRRVAGVIVVTDRLLEPSDAFAFEARPRRIASATVNAWL
jgi:hypothetical protein